MPFSEKIKLEVKHRSAFRCCRCQAIGVEIHHIISEAQGGPSTIDNAAPLCAKCHADFGDNLLKRKEIREMRDWWYQKAATMFSKISPEYSQLEQKLDYLLSQMSQNNQAIVQVKSVLHDYHKLLIDQITEEKLLIDQITEENARDVVSSVVNTIKPVFFGGSPCQMSGQDCPVCNEGIMDIDEEDSGVACNKCGIFIPAG